MNEVSKSELKAKMFEYFRAIEASGEPLVVKDYGNPVLIIQPFRKSLTLAEAFAGVQGEVDLPEDALLESEESDWETLP